jgi:hypothetical protein
LNLVIGIPIDVEIVSPILVLCLTTWIDVASNRMLTKARRSASRLFVAFRIIMKHANGVRFLPIAGMGEYAYNATNRSARLLAHQGLPLAFS